MITYGLNRIFRHTQSDTINRNSGYNGSDTLLFEETNTGPVERPGNKGSKRLGREIS
jgi:hypothetical protein